MGCARAWTLRHEVPRGWACGAYMEPRQSWETEELKNLDVTLLHIKFKDHQILSISWYVALNFNYILILSFVQFKSKG